MSRSVMAVNLLNFNSGQLTGVGYFIKRIFVQLQMEGFSRKIIIFCPFGFKVNEVFGLDHSKLNVEIREIRYVDSFVGRIIFEQFLFYFFLKGVDIFYSPTPAFPILLKWLKPKIKSIVTIHDLIPFFFKDKYPFIRRIYIKILTKLSANNANIVMTVSESSKRDLINMLGISSQKIRIVYNFIPSLSLIEEDTIEKFFLTICTIEPGKNLLNVIKAFSLFKNTESGKDFKFYICGKDGWESDRIYQAVEDLNLTNEVIFTGYLDDTKKNKLISRCFAMVYVSFYEGFGIPPLEAMYFSKPSIVSNNSSLPEVVGKTGILCDPHNTDVISDAMSEMVSKRNVLVLSIPTQLAKFDAAVQTLNFKKAIYE